MVKKELVGIRIQKGLKDQVRNLGGSTSAIAEIAFKEFIQRNKSKQRSSGDCDETTKEANDSVRERNLDSTNFSGSRRRRPGAWRPSGSTSVVDLP